MRTHQTALLCCHSQRWVRPSAPRPKSAEMPLLLPPSASPPIATSEEASRLERWTLRTTAKPLEAKASSSPPRAITALQGSLATPHGVPHGSAREPRLSEQLSIDIATISGDVVLADGGK